MNRPIGFFDSGVGGTSIWKEVIRLLPREHTIYLADSKNAPYGKRTKEEILELSKKNVEILLGKGCKLIVVACNTATTNAIDYLRKEYPVPFIGIEPAIKPAALHTKTKKVGVLATKGTLSSNLFHSTSRVHATGIEIFEQEGKGLVELVESGKQNSNEAKLLLQEFLQPMLEAGIDCLVLGCTHYPYLMPILKQVVPKNIQIIDSGFAVAQQTNRVLTQHGFLNESRTMVQHQFHTNGSKQLLGALIDQEGVSIFETDF